MISPFSGLSLVVHIAIIVFAKAAKLARRAVGATPATATAVATDVILPIGNGRRLFNYFLSVVLILLIAIFMIVAAVAAVQMSIREGANEWHREFLEGRINGSANEEPAYMAATHATVADENEQSAYITPIVSPVVLEEIYLVPTLAYMSTPQLITSNYPSSI